MLLPDFEHTASTAVRIIDNDPATIGFERDLYPMTERVAAPVCVVMQTPAPAITGGVTLTVSAEAGARAELSASELGPFSAAAARHCVDVTPLDEAGFALSLAPTASLPASIAIEPATAEVVLAPRVDYDDDDDNLIDVRTPAQLNALRWDLNGDGVADVPSNGALYGRAYARAFPRAAARMGCPGACAGYELRAAMDLEVLRTATATAANTWSAIGAERDGEPFRAILEGNGNVIYGLYTSATNAVGALGQGANGLFHAIAAGARIRSLGFAGYSNATQTAGITVAGRDNVGVLAGRMSGGFVSAVHVAAGARVIAHGGAAGGLIGEMTGGTIRASYAAASVDAGSGACGGLVGRIAGGGDTPPRIEASYARGAVAAGTSGGDCASGDAAGGLIGATDSGAGATITASYWDASVTTHTGGGGSSRTTAQLQEPRTYVGDYAAWNLDLDGRGGGDTPWYFGTTGQYPVLRYGRDVPAWAVQHGDYDYDDDNLIDVHVPVQLDAIRWDENGDGVPDDASAAGAALHGAAFHGAVAGMGCATTCTGFELVGDLDLAASRYPEWRRRLPSWRTTWRTLLASTLRRRRLRHLEPGRQLKAATRPRACSASSPRAR